MSFFSTPLSGLTATSTALQTISNNLANMNTDGYKARNIVFSDVFYANLGTNGNSDPIQVGLGTKVQGISENLSNGAVAATGVNSNMALEGAGFFVTSNANGATSYTRAGNFTTNTAGQLTTLSGNQVMGYPAAAGVISTTGALQPLNVGKGTSIPASATSSFSLTTNLDASAATGTNFQSTVDVYDSLGSQQLVTVTYTKTAANTWNYNATIPSSALQGGSGTTTSVGSGTFTFDSTGALVPPSSPVTLSIGAFADGAKAMNPTWKLADSNGTSLLTQTSSASTNAAKLQNGYAAGTLTDFSVLSDGTVQGAFSNGQTSAIGQVAVANFTNPEGLSLAGDSSYLATSASGLASVGTAGTGGRGVIKGSSVENSNVDVATEFSALIIAQRSYEANAKAISAFDQVEQATIQMKGA